MALTHSEFNESGNNFNRISLLIQPQGTVRGQGSFESSKCEENLSQSSAHLEYQKIQTGDKPFVFSGCTSSSYQNADLTVHQRTQTEEKFYQCKHGKSLHQNSSVYVREVTQLRSHLKVMNAVNSFTRKHISFTIRGPTQRRKPMNVRNAGDPFVQIHTLVIILVLI